MNIKNNHAITLISLALTVIVAMILVGVTVNSLSGDTAISESQRYQTNMQNTQNRVETEIDVLYNQLQNQT